MKKIRNILFILSLTFAFNFIPVDMNAQCPMCRMSAEKNLEEGGTMGAGLNKGILYMLLMPYMLVGTIGVLWYRNRKKDEEGE